MKQILRYTPFCLLISVGCSTIKETSNRQMETGIYKVSNQHNQRCYAVVDKDSISLYPVTKTKEGWLADTSIKTVLLPQPNVESKQSVTFTSGSFDLDVLTILFKYRPAIAGFPNQLNTNFNGTGYIGYRSDIYIRSYDKNPVNIYQTRMSQFAYSIGLFLGIGATTMNPSVTNNPISSEYDGVVLTKGIAGLVGIGNLTFGLAIGFDHLIDRNKNVWIYQSKPWTGFTVGLNLN